MGLSCLQAGVDAPPEEEVLEGALDGYGLDDIVDEDLSYAALLANKLALGEGIDGSGSLGVNGLGDSRRADETRWDLQRQVSSSTELPEPRFKAFQGSLYSLPPSIDPSCASPR